MMQKKSGLRRPTALLLASSLCSIALSAAAVDDIAMQTSYTPGANLVILHSGQRFGDIEPCACPQINAGGVDREAKKIFNLRQHLSAVVTVEAGAIISPYGDEDFNRIKLEYMLRALSEMDYDAVNVGHAELKAGPGYLKKWEQEYKTPLISANILGADGKPLFEPFRLIRRANAEGEELTIAITGITAERYIPEPPTPDRAPSRDFDPDTPITVFNTPEGDEDVQRIEARLMDYRPRLKAVLDTLQGQADAVIVLFDGGLYEGKRLAREFDVDMILTNEFKNPPEAPASQPEIVEGTILSYCGQRGRALGRIDVAAGKQDGLSLNKGYAIHIRKSDTPEEGLTRLLQDYKYATARLIEQKTRGTQRRVNYTGADHCRKCHPDEYAHWSGSAHAHAFDLLMQAGKEGDEELLARAVTGWNEPGGFTSILESSYLVNVQCESCHGPGHTHRVMMTLREFAEKFPQQNIPVRPAPMKMDMTEEFCATCHDAKHDPDFDFKTALEAVKHTVNGAAPATPAAN